MFLFLLLGHTSPACTSEAVFPLLYGNGEADLIINDVAYLSSGNIVVVGMQKITKSAGAGFINAIDVHVKQRNFGILSF